MAANGRFANRDLHPAEIVGCDLPEVLGSRKVPGCKRSCERHTQQVLSYAEMFPDEIAPPPHIELRVAPGSHPRHLVVTATSDSSFVRTGPIRSEFAPHVDFASILDLYAFAVAVGCFGDAPLVSANETARAKKGTTDVLISTLELMALPVEALRPFVTKAAAANKLGGSIVRVVVEERREPPAPVVDIGLLPLLPAPPIRFAVEQPSSFDELATGRHVVITFRDVVEEGAVSRVQGAFEAWAGILVGGFETTTGRPSMGWLKGVSASTSTELVASLDSAIAPRDAWNALFRALSVVDREAQPIERLKIT